MRKKFLKTCAALLSSIFVISSAAAGGTVAQAAEPGADTEGVIPSIKYGVRIVDTDDYITAVRQTMSDAKDVQSAIDAVNHYVPEVDNSKSPYFPEVGSQISGSCAAWANIYYQFTHETNKKLNRTATHETTFHPFFIYSLIRGGVYGGSWPWDIYELLNNNGCATYSELPDLTDWKTWNADFDVWRAANNYRVTSYMFYENVGNKNSRITSATDSDLDAIKATLRNGDIIGFLGYISSYKTTKLKAASDPAINKGVVGESVITKQIGVDGYHAMTIVGYNDNIWTDINNNNAIDEGEMGAFKMVNSWGTGYENGGFCWIAYDSLNTASVVKGVASESNRYSVMRDYTKLNIDKNFKSSNIYLKYTLNTNNRTDSYLEISARRKSDGVTFKKKTAPYYLISQSGAAALGYDGTENATDGTMICDLDNIIKGLNSENFHDYSWSVNFVDTGKDTAALTVKDAIIVDEEAGKTYPLDTAFPFTVSAAAKNVAVKPCYNFSKIAVSPKENITVNKAVKIVVNAENETRGSDPVKYHVKIRKDGKLVYAKAFKASQVDSVNHTAVASIKYTPAEVGLYKATVTATDASGSISSRSISFKAYAEELAVRSVTFDTGKYVGNYEKVKIIPRVTGGTAPYTYSYYFTKNNKTYKIAENTKSAYKTKTFGASNGNYKITVKVKDAAGKTAEGFAYLKVSPLTISRLDYSNENLQVGYTTAISAVVKNASSAITAANYVYTVTKDGKTETLETNSEKKAFWKPTAEGTYTVRLDIKYNDATLAFKEDVYEVSKVDEHANMIKINVNVITYVYNEIRESTVPYTLHYWNNNGLVGDVKCEALNTTKQKDVGFWGSAQTFRQYVAYIPKAATGYKFHIGDRWFPDGTQVGDGNVSTSNTVYVFNYDFDRCVYTKE